MIFFKTENVDLLAYLPVFMQEYKQIKEIMDTENPEFNLLWQKLKELFGNQFIEYCNEEGISKFEQMLKLHRYENDTLEIRIFRVLTYWNDNIPYTWRVLVNKMDQLCGIGKYELRLDNNSYTLYITTKFDDEKKYDELNNMLKIIIPANLGINSVNVLTPKVENKIYLSNGVINYIKYKIEATIPSPVFGVFATTGFAHGKKYIIGG